MKKFYITILSMFISFNSFAVAFNSPINLDDADKSIHIMGEKMPFYSSDNLIKFYDENNNLISELNDWNGGFFSFNKEGKTLYYVDSDKYTNFKAVYPSGKTINIVYKRLNYYISKGGMGGREFFVDYYDLTEDGIKSFNKDYLKYKVKSLF